MSSFGKTNSYSPTKTKNMQLSFTKMHGLGNDFIVIDATQQPFTLSSQQIQQLANRHFGIGFDQLLVVEPSEQADFRYRIFNSDGGEVEQCGNGARCFALYVQQKNLSNKTELRVETNSGLITLTVEQDGQVTVNMGPPIFAPDQVPFIADSEAISYSIECNGELIDVAVVSMQNPHAVVLCDSIDTAPVESLGPILESHPRFPRRVNVGFMEVVNSEQIRLRVFERGVGETKACGTGACAAVVAGIRLGKLTNDVKVNLLGGRLNIRWQGGTTPVWMRGPATIVFEGKIDL